MFRPSRNRRICKWTGVGLTITITGLWAASLFYKATVVTPNNWLVIFDSGFAGVGTADIDVRDVWHEDTALVSHRLGEFGFRLPEIGLNCQHFHSAIITRVMLPFWFLLFLAAVPTLWTWHYDRPPRFPFGHCRWCGYDLTGNTSGVCSECGLFATASPEETSG